MQQRKQGPEEPPLDYYDFAKASLHGGLQQELKSNRLGTILLKKGLIDSAKLQAALEEQKKSDERLGAVLVRMGFVTQDDVLSCVALQTGVPYLSLESYEVDSEVARLLKQEAAVKNEAVVIDKIDETLLVTMADPMDQEARDDLQAQLKGYRINFYLSSSEEIEQKLMEIY